MEETTKIAPEEISVPQEISSPLTEFQHKALEEAEAELEKLKKEIESRKYLVDVDKNDIKKLEAFILNDAPWKFTESLGIVEVEKEMKKAVKEGKLFTTNVAIEAIYYYLSKVEGKGRNTDATAFDSVDDYLRILKGVTSAIERMKADNERVRQAEFVVAARREGIEPDQTSPEA